MKYNSETSLLNKYSIKNFKGKLTLFLGIVCLSWISFISYLFYDSKITESKILEVESVRYPLSNSLDELNITIDLQVTSIKESIFNRDPKINEKAIEIWEIVALRNLHYLRDHKDALSEKSVVNIDTIRALAKAFHEKHLLIAGLVKDNYTNHLTDDEIINELEREMLFPMVRKLEVIQKNLKEQIQDLIADNEKQLRSNIDEIHMNVKTTANLGISIGAIIVICLMSGGYFLMKRFKKSLDDSSLILKKLVSGETSEYVTPPKDELGEIISAANTLSTNLQQASTFAHNIGAGNVEFEFNPVSERDLLGNALVQMRNKLKSINEADTKRNWVTEGLAKFADLIRKNDDYESLSTSVVSELIKYTNSNQGGLFILNRDLEDQPYLQMSACYAYDRKKFQEKRIEIGEGLVGQCYLEKQTIYLQDVPGNYVTITSGLGGATPSSILIVPLKVNDLIEGIIEIASFHKYKDFEIEFVEKVSESIASVISKSRINDKTKKLLLDSQQQSEELRAQEEEMRQNMEEMQATQEELQRQSDAMKGIQERFELERGMFELLMESLPDTITYKNRESKIMQINKAIANKFKIRPEDAIGKTDFDFYGQEYAEKSFLNEQEVINKGKAILDVEEKSEYTNGQPHWSSVSRIPLLGANKQVEGMFVISKDITELKQIQNSLLDREIAIQYLLNELPMFIYSLSKDLIITNVKLSALLKDINEQAIVGKKVKELFSSIYSELTENKDSISTDCMLFVNDKELTFKHHVFKDHVKEGEYWGYAILQ